MSNGLPAGKDGVFVPAGIQQKETLSTEGAGNAVEAFGRGFERNAGEAVGGAVGLWAGAKGGALAGAGIGGAIGSAIPGAGTAAGAAVGSAIGGIVGGLAGLFGGGWIGKRTQRAVMGEEAWQRAEEQYQRDMAAHPLATLGGSLAPHAATMLVAPGGALKLGSKGATAAKAARAGTVEWIEAGKAGKVSADALQIARDVQKSGEAVRTSAKWLRTKRAAAAVANKTGAAGKAAVEKISRRTVETLAQDIRAYNTALDAEKAALDAARAAGVPVIGRVGQARVTKTWLAGKTAYMGRSATDYGEGEYNAYAPEVHTTTGDRLLTDAEVAWAAQQKGAKGFLNQFLTERVTDPDKLIGSIPFLGSWHNAAKQRDIEARRKRLADPAAAYGLDYQSNPQYLRDRERVIADENARRIDEAREQTLWGIGGIAGQILGDMPAFMVEIANTPTLGSPFAKAAANGGFWKRALAKVGGGAIEAAIQSNFQPGAIAAGYERNRGGEWTITEDEWGILKAAVEKEGDSEAKALWKGWAQNAVEYVSETMGEYMQAGVAAGGRRLMKATKPMPQKLGKFLADVFGTAAPVGRARSMMRAGAVQPFFESLEERAGDFLKAAILADDRDEGENYWQHLLSALNPGWKQWVAETLAFAPMGAVQVAGALKGRKRMEREARESGGGESAGAPAPDTGGAAPTAAASGEDIPDEALVAHKDKLADFLRQHGAPENTISAVASAQNASDIHEAMNAMLVDGAMQALRPRIDEEQWGLLQAYRDPRQRLAHAARLVGRYSEMDNALLAASAALENEDAPADLLERTVSLLTSLKPEWRELAEEADTPRDALFAIAAQANAELSDGTLNPADPRWKDVTARDLAARLQGAEAAAQDARIADLAAEALVGSLPANLREQYDKLETPEKKAEWLDARLRDPNAALNAVLAVGRHISRPDVDAPDAMLSSALEQLKTRFAGAWAVAGGDSAQGTPKERLAALVAEIDKDEANKEFLEAFSRNPDATDSYDPAFAEMTFAGEDALRPMRAGGMAEDDALADAGNGAEGAMPAAQEAPEGAPVPAPASEPSSPSEAPQGGAEAPEAAPQTESAGETPTPTERKPAESGPTREAMQAMAASQVQQIANDLGIKTGGKSKTQLIDAIRREHDGVWEPAGLTAEQRMNATVILSKWLHDGDSVYLADGSRATVSKDGAFGDATLRSDKHGEIILNEDRALRVLSVYRGASDVTGDIRTTTLGDLPDTTKEKQERATLIAKRLPGVKVMVYAQENKAKIDRLLAETYKDDPKGRQKLENSFKEFEKSGKAFYDPKSKTIWIGPRSDFSSLPHEVFHSIIHWSEAHAPGLHQQLTDLLKNPPESALAWARENYQAERETKLAQEALNAVRDEAVRWANRHYQGETEAVIRQKAGEKAQELAEQYFEKHYKERVSDYLLEEAQAELWGRTLAEDISAEERREARRLVDSLAESEMSWWDKIRELCARILERFVAHVPEASRGRTADGKPIDISSLEKSIADKTATPEQTARILYYAIFGGTGIDWQGREWQQQPQAQTGPSSTETGPTSRATGPSSASTLNLGQTESALDLTGGASAAPASAPATPVGEPAFTAERSGSKVVRIPQSPMGWLDPAIKAATIRAEAARRGLKGVDPSTPLARVRQLLKAHDSRRERGKELRAQAATRAFNDPMLNFLFGDGRIIKVPSENARERARNGGTKIGGEWDGFERARFPGIGDKFRPVESGWDHIDSIMQEVHHAMHGADGTAESEADYTMDDFWTDLERACKSEASFKAMLKDQEREGAQYERFTKDALSARQGTQSVPVETLGTGDKVNVKGVELTVENVTDEGTVTLSDGDRYGEQSVQDGQTLHVDAVSTRAENEAAAKAGLPDRAALAAMSKSQLADQMKAEGLSAPDSRTLATTPKASLVARIVSARRRNGIAQPEEAAGGEDVPFQRGGTDGVHWQHGAPTPEERAEAKRQYDAVVARYTNPDGTKKPGWMKAPNGQTSRLNPRQWVQTRTENFKNWFGDWETAATCREMEYMPPLRVTKRPENVSVEDAYASLGTGTNRRDGRTVLFVNSALGKILRHKGYPTERIVHQLKDILEEAVPIGFRPVEDRPGHKQHRNFKGYHDYVGKIEDADGTFYVRITVQELKTRSTKTPPNEFHSSFVSDVALYRGTDALALNTVNDAGKVGALGSTDKVLQQLFAKGKSASRAVDENGEPRVVWHGTNADFWAFDPDRVGENYGIDDEGFFFSSSKEEAENYAQDKADVKGGTGITFPVFLNIRNPEVVKAEPDDSDNPEGNPDRYFDARNPEIWAMAKSAHRDGIIVRGANGNTSFIVLDPNQIKSATDNIGTFSDRDDMRWQRGSASTPFRLEQQTPEQIAEENAAAKRLQKQEASALAREAAEQARAESARRQEFDDLHQGRLDIGLPGETDSLFAPRQNRKWGGGGQLFQRGAPARDWSAATIPEMRKELAARGLPTSGDAPRLRIRLAGADNRRTLDTGNDPDNGVRWQADRPVERRKNLVAFHNVSAKGLAGMESLGGLAMPSFSVTKDTIGGNEFGEISLLVHPRTIDPKKPGNKIFTNDAWTPTFPETKLKMDEKKASALHSKVYRLFKDSPWKSFADGWSADIDSDNIDDAVNKRDGDGVAALRDQKTFKVAFMLDSGIASELPMEEKPVFGETWRLMGIENGDLPAIAEVFGSRLTVDGQPLTWDEADALLQDGDFQKELADFLDSRPGAKKVSAEHGGRSFAMRIQNHQAQPLRSDWDAVQLSEAVAKHLRGDKPDLVPDRSAATAAVDKAIEEHSGEYEAWLRDLTDGITTGKRYVRNKRDPFTPDGRSRSFSQLYDELTLANAVKAMSQQQVESGGGIFGRNPFGVSAREYQSLKAVIADEDRLQPKDREKYDARRKELINRFSALTSKLADTYTGGEHNGFIVHGRAADALMEEWFNARDNKPAVLEGIKQWHGYHPSTEIVDELADIMHAMSSMPEDYFEAKAYRAVGFDEIEAAVVPDNASKETRDILSRHAIRTFDYKAGDNTDRLAKLNEAADTGGLKFQKGDAAPSDWSAATIPEMRRELVARGLSPQGGADMLRKRLAEDDERRAESDDGIRFQRDSVRPWPKDFPKVVVHTTRQAIMSKHAADFEKAKAGDLKAAVRLVRAVVKPERVRELVARHPNAIVVPVNAVEASGHNRIPIAYAKMLADAGLEEGRGIVQSVKANHTGADAFDRLLRRAEFSGPVQAGREYILVDDHVTQGGSLSELRHYIENNGGKVVEISTLTASKGSTTLPIQEGTIAALKAKFGPNLANELAAANIAGMLEALTESEGRYLLKLSPDTFRSRIASPGLRQLLGPDGLQRPVQEVGQPPAVREENSGQLLLDIPAPAVDAYASRHALTPERKAGLSEGLKKARRFAEKTRAAYDRAFHPGATGENWREAFSTREANRGKFPTVSRIIRRLYERPGSFGASVKGLRLDNAEDVASMMMSVRSPFQEMAKVVFVDGKRRVLDARIVHLGGIDVSVVDPMTLFGDIPKGAKGFIFSHNHPSGNPAPSRQDQAVTWKLRWISDVLGLQMHDHVVTDGERYWSFMMGGEGTLPEGHQSHEDWEVGQPIQITGAPDVSRIAGLVRQGADTGVVLALDTQNCIRSVRIIPKGFVDALRETAIGRGGYSDAFFGHALDTGANGVIVYLPKGTLARRQVERIASDASALNIRVLDIIQDAEAPAELPESFASTHPAWLAPVAADAGNYRFQRGGLYTGSAADYAQRDENGNIANGPSLQHIGTGEGSQVYGWGLYASDQKGVAESYASRGMVETKINGKRVDYADPETPEGVVANHSRSVVLRFGSATTREDVIQSIARTFENYERRSRDKTAWNRGRLVELTKKYRKALKLLRNESNTFSTRPRGNIYEQTFFTNRATPAETERHLLSWYEPVGKTRFNRLVAELKKDYPFRKTTFSGGLSFMPEGNGMEVNTGFEATATGEELYALATELTGSPKAASEWLAAHGIDGIKYPVDSYGGKTIKDGDTAGWNYVSFRDDNIRVDHKWRDGEMLFQKGGDASAQLRFDNPWENAHVELWDSGKGKGWHVRSADGEDLGHYATQESAEFALAQERAMLDAAGNALTKLKKAKIAEIAEARRKLIGIMRKADATKEERADAIAAMGRALGLHPDLAAKEWKVAESILRTHDPESSEAAAERAERIVNTVLARASIKLHGRDMMRLVKEKAAGKVTGGMRKNVLLPVQKAFALIREEMTEDEKARRLSEMSAAIEAEEAELNSGEGKELTPAELDARREALAQKQMDMELLAVFGGLSTIHGGQNRARLAVDARAWADASAYLSDLTGKSVQELKEKLIARATAAKEKREQIIREMTGGNPIPSSNQERQDAKNARGFRQRAAELVRGLVSYSMGGGKAWGEMITRDKSVGFGESAASHLFHDGLAAGYKAEMEANERDRTEGLRILSEHFDIDPNTDIHQLVDFSEKCGDLFNKEAVDENGSHEITVRSVHVKGTGRKREISVVAGGPCTLKLGELMHFYLIGLQAEEAAGQAYTDTPKHSKGVDCSLMESLVRRGYAAETMMEIRRALQKRGLDRLAMAISADMEKKGDALDALMASEYNSVLKRVHPYAPLRRLHWGLSEKGDAEGGGVGSFMSMVRSFLKERVANNRDFQTVNLIESWQSHNRQANHIIHLHDWISTVGRVMRHADMQSALDFVVGDRTRRALNAWLDIQARGGSMVIRDDGQIGLLARNFAVAVTTNPRVALKQLTSPGMALGMLPEGASTWDWFKDMMAIAKPDMSKVGMPNKTMQNFLAFLDGNSPEWRERGLNASDALQLINRHKAGDKWELLRLKVQRRLGAMTRWGDRRGALMGCYGVFKAWERKFLAEHMDPSSAKIAALEKFVDSVNAGQQSTLPEYMSQVQTMGGLYKYMSMFHTAQIAMTRNIYTHAKAWLEGRGSRREHARAIAGVVTSAWAFRLMGMGMLPLAQIILGLLQGDKDKLKTGATKTIQEGLMSIVEAPCSGVIPMWPLGDTIVSAFEYPVKGGSTWGRTGNVDVIPQLSVFTTALRILDDFRKKADKRDWLAVSRHAADFIGQTTGIPVTPVIDLGSGLHDAATGTDLTPEQRAARALTFSRSAIGAPKRKPAPKQPAPTSDPWTTPAGQEWMYGLPAPATPSAGLRTTPAPRR